MLFFLNIVYSFYPVRHVNPVKKLNKKLKTIILISDSHNLIRPEICEHVKNADYVIHAGDICSSKIYKEFRNLNDNITFVRGNMDRIQELPDVPETNVLSIAGYHFYILHEIEKLDLYPLRSFDFVVFGHSHKPEKYIKDKVLYLNPGSIGPRRFDLPISFAKVFINEDGEFKVEFFRVEKSNKETK